MASSSRVTPQHSLLAAILVFAGLSLAHWAPIARFEQLPVVLLRPFEELASSALPSPSAGDRQAVAALASDARLAWDGWARAVEQDGPPPPPGTHQLAAA